MSKSDPRDPHGFMSDMRSLKHNMKSNTTDAQLAADFVALVANRYLGKCKRDKHLAWRASRKWNALVKRVGVLKAFWLCQGAW